MKPLETPGWAARKAGSPWLRSGLTRRSMRRSAMPASVVRAMAAVSKARASGAPWKLPPESTALDSEPDSTNTSGLSVADPVSISQGPAHRAVRLHVELGADRLQLDGDLGRSHLGADRAQFVDLQHLDMRAEH